VSDGLFAAISGVPGLMHDEVLTLFDDCVSALLRLRANLAANRRVHPGERHDAVLRAISAAEHFATAAKHAVSPAEAAHPALAAPPAEAAHPALAAPPAEAAHPTPALVSASPDPPQIHVLPTPAAALEGAPASRQLTAPHALRTSVPRPPWAPAESHLRADATT
jgi:hypothetical protein